MTNNHPIVRFLKGTISSLNGALKREGQIYFVIKEDNSSGYIKYDVDDKTRIDMNSIYADTSGTAEKVNHKLIFGNQEFDGSKDVTIDVYGGETMEKGE